jgi:hypothetical protein
VLGNALGELGQLLLGISLEGFSLGDALGELGQLRYEFNEVA